MIRQTLERLLAGMAQPKPFGHQAEPTRDSRGINLQLVDQARLDRQFLLELPDQPDYLVRHEVVEGVRGRAKRAEQVRIFGPNIEAVQTIRDRREVVGVQDARRPGLRPGIFDEQDPRPPD